MITMRLVCDNYVIQTTSMEHMQTRITSTASATTSYHVQFLPAQTAISAKSANSHNSHNSQIAHILFNCHYLS